MSTPATLPPPPEQWPAHMNAMQVAHVTGCSTQQVYKAARSGELSPSCARGAYGRKLWSRDQVMAWRGVTVEPKDPFINARVA